MDERKKETSSSMLAIYSALFLILTFLVSFSAARELQSQTKEQTRSPNRFGSSLVFPVQGDVYPNGYACDAQLRIFYLMYSNLLHMGVYLYDTFIFYFNLLYRF